MLSACRASAVDPSNEFGVAAAGSAADVDVCAAAAAVSCHCGLCCVHSSECAELVGLHAEADRLCGMCVSRAHTAVAALTVAASSSDQPSMLKPTAGGGARRRRCSKRGLCCTGGGSAATQRSVSARPHSSGWQRGEQPVRAASPSSTSASSSSSSDCSLSPPASVSSSSSSSSSSSALSIRASAALLSCDGSQAVKERRSKLPLRAVYALRSFFTAHVSHPYPTDEQKADLARQCGLTARQVTNWFTNTRRRFLVPFLSKLARAATVGSVTLAAAGQAGSRSTQPPVEPPLQPAALSERWMASGGTWMSELAPGGSEADVHRSSSPQRSEVVADGDGEERWPDVMAVSDTQTSESHVQSAERWHPPVIARSTVQGQIRAV